MCEAIRKWCLKFGQPDANQLRRRHPQRGDTGHLDEVILIQGFKSAGHAQRFLAAYGPMAQPCRPCRHLLPAAKDRQEMRQRFHTW
jgi:hypothetical protein